jgi:hypothetical protein
LKKLLGNRDIEDSLERLDKLTQEEARMASAELLKMTHSIDGKVMGVDDRVKGVEGKMQDVADNVQDVGSMVQIAEERVRGDVQDVGGMVQIAEGRVRGDVQDIRHKVQDVDDKLDHANRSLFLQHLQVLIILTAQTTSQGTSSEITFYDGYRRPIHPPIITSHAKLITTVQLNGSFKAVYSVNGNQPAPSCGYTENVRYIWPSPCIQPLIVSSFYSGVWEKCALVCLSFDSFRPCEIDILISVPRSYKIS